MGGDGKDAPVSKYDSLRDHLLAEPGDRVAMSFDELAAVIPGGLPPSAYNHQAWWSNEAAGSHVQARSWLDAGFRTEGVNLTSRRVVFVRDA